MKTHLYSFIHYSVLAVFITTNAAWGADSNKCDNICKKFKNATSEEAIQNACGTPDGQPVEKISNSQKTYTSYSACISDFSNDWKLLSDHCNAYMLYEDSQAGELTTAIAYAIAAAACWGACVAQGTQAGPALAIICTAGSIASAAFDIGVTMGLLGDNKPYNQWYSSLSSVSGSLAGAGLAMGVGKDLLTSGTSVKDAFKANYPCLTAGMLTIPAIAKGISYGIQVHNGKKECSIIAEHPLPNSGTVSYGEEISSDEKKSNTPKTSGTDSGQFGGKNTKNPSDSKQLPETLDFNDPNNQFAKALMAGPMGELYKNDNPHRNKLGEQGLKALNKTIPEIKQALASGMSAAELLGGISGAPEGLGPKLKELEQMVRDGTIQMNGVVGTGYAQTGSGKTGAITSTQTTKTGFGLFGSKTPTNSISRTADFAKFTKKEYVGGDGDIWHESWDGTIFQIVSGKLNKTRDRIETLEWDTPLNRALMGLPAKKPNRYLGGGK